MKKLLKIFKMIVVVLAVGYWGAPKVALKIASYLVIQEEVETVDYLVSDLFSKRALDYLKAGKAKFIVIVVDDSPKGVWKALYDEKADLKIREQARKLKIPQEKILIYKRKFLGKIDQVIFYKHVLKELKAKSALFFVQFYHTRTHRFFLDEYFSGVDIKTYVQSENPASPELLDDWWTRTTYANLFLEQYLTIGFYYLNKVLWTRAV
jgi:hypothetical protein